MLTIDSSITGTDSYSLAAPYTVSFSAVNDISNYASVTITDTQLDRLTQTITYEVTITNTADFDLLLPLELTLDPANYVQGGPQGAADQDNPQMAVGSSASRATVFWRRGADTG